MDDYSEIRQKAWNIKDTAQKIVTECNSEYVWKDRILRNISEIENEIIFIKRRLEE